MMTPEIDMRDGDVLMAVSPTAQKFLAMQATSYHVSPMQDGSFVLHLSAGDRMFNFRYLPDLEDGSTDTTRGYVQQLRDVARTILEKTDKVRQAKLTELQERAELKRLSEKYAQ